MRKKHAKLIKAVAAHYEARGMGFRARKLKREFAKLSPREKGSFTEYMQAVLSRSEGDVAKGDL